MKLYKTKKMEKLEKLNLEEFLRDSKKMMKLVEDLNVDNVDEKQLEEINNLTHKFEEKYKDVLNTSQTDLDTDE